MLAPSGAPRPADVAAGVGSELGAGIISAVGLATGILSREAVLGLGSVPLARCRGLPAWMMTPERPGLGAAVVPPSRLAGRAAAPRFLP